MIRKNIWIIITLIKMFLNKSKKISDRFILRKSMAAAKKQKLIRLWRIGKILSLSFLIRVKIQLGNIITNSKAWKERTMISRRRCFTPFFFLRIPNARSWMIKWILIVWLLRRIRRIMACPAKSDRHYNTFFGGLTRL